MTAQATPVERIQSRPASSRLPERLALYVLLLLFTLFFLLPLVWMFSTALKPFEEWVQFNWIPRNPTLENFRSIFADPSVPVLRWFANSLGIATVFTLLVLVIDAMAAYAYARMEFRGRSALFGLLLATLVMPGIMFLIPNYITIARLGWINTYQGVIAPGLAGVFGVFFLRQFFLSLPRELEEAAYIDGASVWTTFLRVALPLSRGALATLAVITFMASWNDFLWPLVVMNAREMQTLPVGLATLQGQYTFDYGKLMAGAAVTAIPVLVLYLFLQRYIVQSVAITGLKG
ncbi:carbohydrate ABC transporter permease [Kallotenue papyrolyticum]|uniref:carbohydrate ABC transporter permease n=1 Tax=Kallotenue papyrolyticum TaxID=1325125 RepID=UPI000492AFB4|nr:carbohydrate ABC transporter permease [Kallotenue papyrolyticum]